jgi:hypothetical protein
VLGGIINGLVLDVLSKVPYVCFIRIYQTVRRQILEDRDTGSTHHREKLKYKVVQK